MTVSVVGAPAIAENGLPRDGLDLVNCAGALVFIIIGDVIKIHNVRQLRK